jgi:L-ribulose-5-phosphate 3-epimerase
MAIIKTIQGRRVGGPVWDLHPLLKDRDPEFLGVQYDIRHATVEGAVSWPLGMKLMAPWIKTIDIKDFIWEENEKGEWKIKNVPLGEGMVNFKEYFELYKSMNIEAPVSIHYEYDLGGAEHGNRNPSITAEEMAVWLKKGSGISGESVPAIWPVAENWSFELHKQYRIK